MTIGGTAAKSGKNTHLVVIMRVRLSLKIGLHNLTNQDCKKIERARKTYKKYYQLLLNSFNVTYAHLITTRTQILTSFHPWSAVEIDTFV